MRFKALKAIPDQTVWADFEERPESVLVYITDPSGVELLDWTSDNVTIGPHTTVSGDCGFSQSDRRQVSVNSLTDLSPLHTYRIENTSQQVEYVQLLSIPINGVCATDTELAYDYEAGDSFDSVRVTLSLTTDEVPTLQRGYQVTFSGLMSNDFSVYRTCQYDVVTHLATQPVTQKNLGDLEPMLVSKLPKPARGTDWKIQLDRAWSDVEEDLERLDTPADIVLDESQLTNLQLYKLKQNICEMGIDIMNQGEMANAIESARYFSIMYDRELGTIKNRLHVDKDQDKAPDVRRIETLEIIQ